MQASELQSDNAPEAATDVVNRNGAPPHPLEQPGQGDNVNRHHRRPSEGSASYAREIIHVAYRHSDLDSGRSQQQAASGGGVGGGVPSPSASPSAAARVAGPRATSEGAKRFTESTSSLRAQTTVRHAAEQRADDPGAEGQQQEEQVLAGGQRDRATGGGPESRQRSLLASESFRMPAAVGNGVGWGWDRGPFGAWPECPSSPRVLQIGIAMDTGYFKVCVPFEAAAEHVWTRFLSTSSFKKLCKGESTHPTAAQSQQQRSVLTHIDAVSCSCRNGLR